MTRTRAAVIAGTHSSVGKTTWFLALASFFRKKGLAVQPFKVGPDYIDPGFHHFVCHPRKSRNLDHFFLSENYLKESFERNSRGADLALVEGVMGLYDGRGPLSEEGSTAQMAKRLGLPVFLVVDGSGLARSAAALVKGYKEFDPLLDLRGVFVNRVGSEGHFRYLKEPIEKEAGIPVLGWLPEETEVSIPERHLGLKTAVEEASIQTKLARLAELLEGRFDAERFLALCQTVIARSPAGGLSLRAPRSGAKQSTGSGQAPQSPSTEIASALFGTPPRNDEYGLAKTAPHCRIGVAYDRAFSFYYEDNFDLLREAGAEIIFFSPLSDDKIPSDLDALYLGGGFPELYAEALSQNESMKRSVRELHEAGGLFYAECGGLIYLAERFVDSKGQSFPLVGLIPGTIRMTGRLQNFGYHEIETQEETFLFPKGKKLRSHEFHYSVWETEKKEFVQPFKIQDRNDGFYDGKILASYQHLHWGQDPELARVFARRCSKARPKPACRQAGQSQSLEIASSALRASSQ